MTREDILGQLRETMKDSSPEPINWDTLTEDTTIGELGFDSLSILDLIYYVQQAFGVEVALPVNQIAHDQQFPCPALIDQRDGFIQPVHGRRAPVIMEIRQQSDPGFPRFCHSAY